MLLGQMLEQQGQQVELNLVQDYIQVLAELVGSDIMGILIYMDRTVKMEPLTHQQKVLVEGLLFLVEELLEQLL